MKNNDKEVFDIPQDSSINSSVSRGHIKKDCWCKKDENNPLCILKNVSGEKHWIPRHLDMSEIADILGL